MRCGPCNKYMWTEEMQESEYGIAALRDIAERTAHHGVSKQWADATAGCATTVPQCLFSCRCEMWKTRPSLVGPFAVPVVPGIEDQLLREYVAADGSDDAVPGHWVPLQADAPPKAMPVVSRAAPKVGSDVGTICETTVAKSKGVRKRIFTGAHVAAQDHRRGGGA